MRAAARQRWRYRAARRSCRWGFTSHRISSKSIQGHIHDRTTLGAWQMRGELFVKVGEPWLPPAMDAADRSYRYLRDLTNRMMDQVSTLFQQAQQLAGRK